MPCGPVGFGNSGEWSASHDLREDMCDSGWGRTLVIGIIFLRKSAGAGLRHRGEEIEGSVRYVFGDLRLVYRTSDIDVEWILLLGRRTVRR